jgi:predicted transcriptional regulator
MNDYYSLEKNCIFCQKLITQSLLIHRISLKVEVKIQMEHSISETFYVLDELINLLSPSAQKVFQILQSKEKMHVNEIVSNSEYSLRTIQNALKQLIAAGLITQVLDFTDMRRRYYTVNHKLTF